MSNAGSLSLSLSLPPLPWLCVRKRLQTVMPENTYNIKCQTSHIHQRTLGAKLLVFVSQEVVIKH